MSEVIKYGTASEFQKKNRILVSTLAAYGGREVPRGFDWLKKSCDKFGVELSILGDSMMFDNMYNTKLEYLGYCLWQLRNDYDYVINIDSADTLILRPLDGSVQQFQNMTFCAERNEFPLEQLREPLIKKTEKWGTTYRFLNAGCFAGNMVDVVKTFAYMRYKRSVLNDVPEMTHGTCTTFSDDQAAWNLEFLNGYVNIDDKCRLFQSLWGVDRQRDILYNSKGLLNLEHNTRAFVVHANGSAEYEDIYNKVILSL